MLVIEFGKHISVDADLSVCAVEDTLYSLPSSSDYLLRVPVQHSIDAVTIKELFEEKTAKAHAPVRIHIIVDEKPGNPDEWQLFSLSGSVWSEGA